MPPPPFPTQLSHSLAPIPLALSPAAKEAARPPQPAAWGADAASSPPVVGRLVASAQVNDSVTMGQVRNVLLRAIEDCAVFPGQAAALPAGRLVPSFSPRLPPPPAPTQ